MSDGTSSARTTVASSATASAVPMPSSLMMTMRDVANAPMAMQKSNAAAVTTRPVRCSPSATDSLSPIPESRSSLMRDRRNTA